MANEMRDAIKGNDHSDIRKIAIAGDAALAAAILANTEPAATVTVADTANRYTGTNVETCLAEIAGAGRTTETVASVDTLIDSHKSAVTGAHAASAISIPADTGAGAVYTAIEVDGALLEIAGAGRTTETVKAAADDIITIKGAGWTSETIKANATAIDALQRTGSTVAVAGAVTDETRAVTLTIKDGDGTAVAKYAMIGVKVTLGDGGEGDTGNPAVIATALTTVDGLTVTGGEQVSPPSGTAIADTKNASLIAYSSATGVLTVTAKTAVNNTYIFVHFIMPDGTVESSTEIKLKEV
jgi:hypothetical protein